MEHHCTIRSKDEDNPKTHISRCIPKLVLQLRKLVLISQENPRASEYFRSEMAFRAEKQRQLNSHPWIIHPLSKFRAYYDMFLILVYFFNLLAKPLDSAFTRRKVELFTGYRRISTTLDMLCWLDICLNFWTGYTVRKLRKIEIRPWSIAKHYISSPYFICDVLSSFPRNAPYVIFQDPSKILIGIVNIFGLLKIIRLCSLIGIIIRTSRYLNFKNRGGWFFICSIIVTIILIHWMACMQFIVPRLTGRYFADPKNPIEKSWIYDNGLYEKGAFYKYTHCFFKSSSEMLGIHLKMYNMNITEDYVVALVTYVVGKILMASIWVILAMSILNAKSMEIKFVEMINQLDEYMKQKQLPLNLRKRISQYYYFKYQKKYYKDEMITNLLSNHLRKEVTINVCRSLISNVPLLSELSHYEIGLLVSKLISEIFLPMDTIIRSGIHSDSMYFLSSGTVAVYTHSGLEVCHLQDGAYFGEIGLVMKHPVSVATVTAIEITHVYRLRKKDFEQSLMKHKEILNKIVIHAESRLKKVMKMEKEYKNEILKRALQQKSDTDGSTITLPVAV